MANRLITVAATIGVIVLLAVAVLSEAAAWRVVGASGGAAVAFLIGVGVGERSKSTFCQHLLRVNSLLADQLRSLSDENLASMPPRTADRESTGQPAGPHQLQLRGRTPR